MTKKEAKDSARIIAKEIATKKAQDATALQTYDPPHIAFATNEEDETNEDDETEEDEEVNQLQADALPYDIEDNEGGGTTEEEHTAGNKKRKVSGSPSQPGKKFK